MIRLTLLLFLVFHSCWWLQGQISMQVEKAFFPDVELESVTPALQKRNGFTKYRDLIQFLEDLQAEKPDLIELRYIGTTQKGRKVPLVQIGTNQSSSEKIRIWYQAGLHGNEPASTEGILYFLYQIVHDPSYASLLNRVALAIVPLANPDGFETQSREAANGKDLNRDQTKFAHPESFYLKKAFSDWNPHLAVDFHEYRPYRRDFISFGKTGVTTSTDAYFLLTGNLNVPLPIRNYLYEDLFTGASQHLNKQGIRTGIYNTTTREFGRLFFSLGAASPRSSATSYALSNCIGLLMEIRGVGLGRTNFQRRVFTIAELAEFYLSLAHKDASRIKTILSEAQALITNLDKEIIVTSFREKEPFDWPNIDLQTQRMSTTPVFARNGLKAKPRLTRKKPVAYLIGKDQQAILDRLKVLGIEMRERQTPTNLEADRYRLIEAWESPKRWEGIYSLNSTTELESTSVSFPNGYYYIPVQQENAGLLFETLEPEAANSMFRYRVFQAEEGGILPIYRYYGQPLN